MATSTESLALSRFLVEVRSILTTSDNVRILNCRRLDGKDIESKPGAHIDVYVADGTPRQYSLLPSEPDAYRFAVKREGRGRGGSRYLHDAVAVGDVIEASAPRNHFRLHENARHTVLFAGGIGITPIYAMVARLAQIGASWELHYTAREGGNALFAEELALAYPNNVQLYGAALGTRPGLRNIIAAAPEEAHFYCCGPQALIASFMEAVLSRPSANVHVEHFHGIAENQQTAFKVILKRSRRTFDVPRNTSLLDMLLASGLEVPHSCREGTCGACEVFVIDGVPEHRDMVLTPEEREANTSMMVCCSGSRSSELTLDL